MYNILMGTGSEDKIILIVFIILAIVLAVFLAIFIPIQVVNSKYKKFVEEYSSALHSLLDINSRYRFKDIPNCDMEGSYDNEHFYNEISCQDYLTYQLVYQQKKVNAALKDTLINKTLNDSYIHEIHQQCHFGVYDCDTLLPNQKRLQKWEKRLFDEAILKPQIEFSIQVVMISRYINGNYRDSKQRVFQPNQIKEILAKLNQKQGKYYLNKDIWDSLCRVERGKVSNKMRFAIYDRDHYRCRMCGSKYNLEIDHIYPISKGGKSTFDNLQTLCHSCNVKKGNKLDY